MCRIAGLVRDKSPEQGARRERKTQLDRVHVLGLIQTSSKGQQTRLPCHLANPKHRNVPRSHISRRDNIEPRQDIPQIPARGSTLYLHILWAEPSATQPFPEPPACYGNRWLSSPGAVIQYPGTQGVALVRIPYSQDTVPLRVSTTYIVSSSFKAYTEALLGFTKKHEDATRVGHIMPS